MMGDVIYQTKYGEVIGAKAPGFDDFSTGFNDTELADVTTLKTAGGLSLMLGLVISWQKGDGRRSTGAEATSRAILYHIRKSVVTDISALLQESLQAVIQAGQASPEVHDRRLSAAVVALSGHRLFLAQVGESLVYLVRGDKLYQIAPGQTARLPASFVNQAGFNEADTQPLRALKMAIPPDEPHYIDHEIYLPQVTGKSFLDLRPGDGLILSGGRMHNSILAPGTQNVLAPNFLRAFRYDTPSLIAHGLMQINPEKRKTGADPVVVIKSESEPGGVIGRSRLNSFLWQAGIIASILVVSAVLGLVAAFGVPKLMATQSVPVTGKSTPVPPGFLSVLDAGQGAQYILSGQDPASLVTGTMIAVSPGTILQTAQGTVRVQLSDGTVIVLGGNTRLVLTNIANAMQQINTTDLHLDRGEALVDTAQSSGTVTQVFSPDQSPSIASGRLFGVQYLPDQTRFTVDCLGGSCQLTVPNGTRNLSAGQQSWVVNGAIGGIEAAQWSLWESMCGNACVSPAPTPLPTPYLGAFSWGDLFKPLRPQTPGGGLGSSNAAAGPVSSAVLSMAILAAGALQMIAAVRKVFRPARAPSTSGGD